MSATYISLIAFATVFGSALLGMRLHRRLTDRYVSPETKDVVRLGMGLVATMTALLLGLMIATAKGSYDTQRSEVIQIAAKVSFLNRALALYGPETSNARESLRRAVENAIPSMWPTGQSQMGKKDGTASEGGSLYDATVMLEPQNDLQRSLKARALDTTVELSKSRMHLAAQEDPTIVTPLIVVVIAWLAIIFLSFGLFAPSNKVVIITVFVVALTVSSAIFLIMELDRPFDGVIQVSSAPMRRLSSQLK